MELASRAVYRGQVTKVVNATNDLFNDLKAKTQDEIVQECESILEELMVLKQRLTAAHGSLCKTNIDVRPFLKADELVKESEAIVDYEDRAITTLARLDQRIGKFSSIQQSRVWQVNPITAPIENCNTVRLPKLDLKSFSGDFREWLPFWEQFKTTIHENNALSVANKFNYLQSAVRGRAAEIIAGFTPTPQCYESAIALLQEEFGRSEKLIDKNMQTLMNLPAVSSRTDAKALRKLYITVLSCSRSLTAMQVSLSTYSVRLKSKLLHCLPNELRVSFYRVQNNSDLARNEETSLESIASVVSNELECSGEYQLKALLKFIKREADSLENASEDRETRKENRLFATAAGLFASNVNNMCYFCKSKSHNSRECDNSITLCQRKAMLKRDGRCFRCTGRGHTSKTCSYRQLACGKCNGRHATSLCDPNYHARASKLKADTAKPVTNNDKQMLNLCTTNELHKRISEVYLQTAAVFAINPKEKRKMYIRLIMDGGSQMTFIKESIATKLNLTPIGKRKVSVVTFGCYRKAPAREHNIVHVCLENQHNGRRIALEAIVVPEICVDVLTVPELQNESNSLLLADARPFSYQPEDGIGLLIGADYYWKCGIGEFKRLTEQFTAINTIFGWTLHGPAPIQSSNGNANLAMFCSVGATSIEEIDCQRLWELEVIGIKSPTEEANSCSASYCSTLIEKSNERFVVRLPWKTSKTLTDNHKTGAAKQLKSLITSLKRCPNKLYEYDRAMREFIDSGIAEPVEDENCSKISRSYYLPHHPVYRYDKSTTKLRIVFNASAHAAYNLSLNDCLNVGPNLLPDVLKILLNFRVGRIALVADIEKAFLQLELHSAERDFHRFFWYSQKITSTERIPPVQIYRMTRVTFGVTSSPFLLTATLKKHFDDESSRYPKTCSVLKGSFYMDDFVCSVKTEDEAIVLYKEAKSILKNASMNLRKWNSNNGQVRDVFFENGSPCEAQKVLGVWWRVFSDELAVDMKGAKEVVSGATTGTKRLVLSVIAKIFDPFGFIGPFLIRLKVLFQSTWKLKLGWDEPLPSNLTPVWTSCCADIGKLENFALSRCLQSSVHQELQLHLFTDASPLGYRAVAYLRIVNEDGFIDTRIVCAKNRVAPLKTNKCDNLTLLKLELTAALIGARLYTYLKTNLNMKFAKVYFWTDSQITLHWIRGTKRWMPYVENKVAEIKGLTMISSWKHVSGKSNPADLLTRGVQADVLLTSTLWISGPEWLRHDTSDWPQEDIEIDCSQLAVISLLIEPCNNSSTFKDPLFAPERFNSWTRILRITAYVIRFTKSLRKHSTASTLDVNSEEIAEAEIYWIRHVQGAHYYEEIHALRKKGKVEKKSSLLTLNPTLDENDVLRARSRLQNLGAEEEDVAQPILLPKASHVTKLIVMDMHCRALHSGVNTVLAELRSRFWIPKARQLIKSVVSKCFVCKVLFSKPASQPFAPLPRDRMAQSRPFEVTGVDFAGPLYIKEPLTQSSEKVYFLLFTCGAVRAIHLELVHTLSTESFMMALRRFVARRGKPGIIYSDNAQTFKRASKELKALNAFVRDSQANKFLSENKIHWKFIVERAPWWGGFWERLIRSVKNALKATMMRSILSKDDLHTVLVEVEAVINSRPLTYISEHPKDLAPLTPMHFLQVFSSGTSTLNDSSKFSSHTCTSDALRRKWDYRQRALHIFWKRWKAEYLIQLRSLMHSRPSSSPIIQPEEVVLVHDNLTPRLQWKLAVVEETFPGRDGKVRACQIRFSNGMKTRRAIQHLYPLELK